MSTPILGPRLRHIARKTLSREEDDSRPIPFDYLTLLLTHFEKYPNEDNFLVDLEQGGGGTITCLDCWTDTILGKEGESEKKLAAFWEHISSGTHQEMSCMRLQELIHSSESSPLSATKESMESRDIGFFSSRPRMWLPEAAGSSKPPKQETGSVNSGNNYAIDVEMDDLTGAPPSTPSQAECNVSGAGTSVKSKKRVQIVFPDGDCIELSTDEEDGAPSHYITPKVDKSGDPSSSTPIPSSSTQGINPSSRLGAAILVQGRRRVRKTVVLDGYPFEYSTDEDDHAGPSASSSSTAIAPHNVSPLPTPSSSNSSLPMVSSSSSRTPHNIIVPLKRPQRGVRRHVFADGEEVYLSTDDEMVDERPGMSSSKKPRLESLDGNVNRVPSKYEGNGLGTSVTSVNSTANGLGIHSKNAPLSGAQRSEITQEQQLRHMTSSSTSTPTSTRTLVSKASPPGYLNRVNNITRSATNAIKPNQFGLPPLPLATSRDNMPGAFGTGLNMGWHAPPTKNDTPGYVRRESAGTFNLNFDDEGPMGKMDLGGSDQREQMKDFFLTAMDAFQETPSIVAAAHDLGLQTTTERLPGMEVALLPHQLIGVNWMIKQEASTVRGGILADDMGLGKTIQCIAICAKNKPPPGQGRRSILVVAPAALLNQWASEFKERTSEGAFLVHIHHGSDKLRTIQEVRKFDVVITTYQTLCGEFTKDKGKGKSTQSQVPQDDSDSEPDNDGPKKIGPLAKTGWWRVVLDEAQYIRNRRTRASRCVAMLDATYRWALTGTPVTNNLADLYGLVRFLHFRPFNDWKAFHERIAKVQRKAPDVAGRRAQAMLKKCLIRRTKHSKVEGQPILQLPPKDIEVVDINFSPEERLIYDRIELQQKQKMSKFIKAGTVMKNYAFILVMLLRLRQVCNHPRLATYAAKELADDETQIVEDEEENSGDTPAAQLAKVEQIMGRPFIEAMQSRFRERVEAQIKAENGGPDAEDEDTECPICFDTLANNCRVTGCRHSFCADCLTEHFKNPPTGLHAQDAAYAEAMQNGSRPCPVCRQSIHPERIFKTELFEPSETELDEIRASIPQTQSSVPRELLGNERALEAELGELDLDLDDDFEPSSKMICMMNLIKQWRMESSDDKIICYSQWTSMLDLMQKHLSKEGIDNLRFDGKMSRLTRDQAVARFKMRKGPSVMLISLKAGGVGLNLTEANRVLSLDLAWNAATENQAFDRVHRMGQQKHVHVKRLVVRNTVEDRILNLQVDKQSLADAALGEGKANKIKKMTARELAALFGM